MNISTPADVRLCRIDQPDDTAALMKESISRLISSSIRIDHERQKVLLSGHVASWYEKQLAQELIRPFVDSDRIENRIRVLTRF